MMRHSQLSQPLWCSWN